MLARNVQHKSILFYRCFVNATLKCYNLAMFEGILGHKKQLEFLSSAISKGKLAHAYIFAGPESVGKRTIALKLAQSILATEGQNFHPDLLEINGQEGIKIEQIRELVYKLSLKPYMAKYKVAIIDAAENMTAEAANALLKCLEEPKPGTILILVTANPNRLPKTIISRTQKITFGPIEGMKEETNEESQRAMQFYEIFKNGRMADKLITAYEIADLETAEIKTLLEQWLKSLQKELQINASKQLAQQIFQVAQSHKFLGQNANAKLLLTNLMINT